MLDALRESEAYENTIVIFASDHGDMQGAHGGMHEKWHVAYEEALHVPFIVSSPLLPGGARELDIPTSHADLIPTLLGLTGIDPDQALARLQADHSDAHPLVGRDLSEAIRAAAPAAPTEPILFTTDDEISEGSATTRSPFGRVAKRLKHYSTVKQPNHLQTVIAELDVDGEPHLVKFSRYFDNAQFWTVPGERDERLQGRHTVTVTEPEPEQYELYDLTLDPIEERNLAHASHSDEHTQALQNTMLALLAEQLAAQAPDPISRRGSGLPPTRDLRHGPMTVTASPKANGAARRTTSSKAVEHLTKTERAARGRAARAEVPRSAHAGWTAPAARRDPIAILEEQALTRVPELVPIRHGRMLVSPFTFYRGAAAIMAADLAGTPRTRLHAQLCGDAHLSNFGAFAAPDRRLVFSVNDFDETLPGPFEWDVKRFVASVAVAGRDRGFDPKRRTPAVVAAARAYREAMHDFAAMRTLDLWYARANVEDAARHWAEAASPRQLKRYERNLAKARAKDSLRAASRLTHTVDGRPRIISDPPLIVPIDELLRPNARAQLETTIRDVVRSYRRTLPSDRRRLLERFHYADAARKVVGVGSVGTRAWIVLMLGVDDADPLFLQLKEAEASVLEPYLTKSDFANHGQRVVEGQRLMQAASDIMLGWFRTAGIDGVQRDFYLRQLWDGKGSALVELMEPDALATYAQICGWSLAKAHARSGDAVAIAAYLGSGTAFDRAMVSFAEDYADQNELDYAAFRRAIDSGRISAAVGL